MAKKAKQAEDVKVVEVKKKAEPKTYTVKCTYPFFDAKEQVQRNLGESWKIDQDRLNQINEVGKANDVQLIEVL